MSVEKKATLFFSIFIPVFIIMLGWAYLSPKQQFNYYEIFTKKAVYGMSIGAPIEMLGVDVGFVKNIELITPTLARIVIAVRKNTPFNENIKAKISARNFPEKMALGSMVVELLESNDTAKAYIPKFKTQYPIIPLISS